MKNSNDTIGNRTCDLPTCSALPQPTAPPAACPRVTLYLLVNIIHVIRPRKIGWAGMWRVWGRGEVHTGFGGRLGVGGILLKWVLKKK